jgi:hypothetical protein
MLKKEKKEETLKRNEKKGRENSEIRVINILFIHKSDDLI